MILQNKLNKINKIIFIRAGNHTPALPRTKAPLPEAGIQAVLSRRQLQEVVARMVD